MDERGAARKKRSGKRPPKAKRTGPVARKADSVLHELGRRIAAGDYGPDDALPTELELGRHFGVSRASLREGLKALAGKGMVESRTRRGTRVLAKARWDLLDPDVLAWISAAPPDPEFLVALLEVRAIVEPAAARMAAQRATAAQIQRIEEAYRGMESAMPDDVEGFCRHDLDLHELIIDASGNMLLKRLVAAIRTTLLAAFRVAVDAREGYENSLAEHRAVAVAISRRAPAEAERAMRMLLSGTARDLAPAFTPAQRRRPPSGRKAKDRSTKEETHGPKNALP